VLTFEELQAWLDSRGIVLTTLPEEPLDDASFYGRIFARSGGLAQAVAHVLEHKGEKDFILKPVVCDGIEACRIALLKKSKNILKENFIEGMACTGGCISGAGCLTHGEKDVGLVEKYGKASSLTTSSDAAARFLSK
jgi:iron only hydrogenase large subunit-like protein